MAQNYNEWLAASVLNGYQYISYRYLSRALKVHSNLAKQMLYEFHRKQNSKTPGSVHATYILTGTRKPVRAENGTQSQQDGEDSTLRSSPPLPSSSMLVQDDEDGEPAIHMRSVMLVREEHMEQAKAQFDSITGIHVYSLQAKGLSDMQVLTDCNRRVATEFAAEDPLKEWKQYGTIQNSGVKRRTGKRPPPQAAPTSNPATVKAKAVASAASKSSAAEIQEANSKPSSKTTPWEPSKPVTSKPAASKTEASSIFKSFAKSAAKPKKSEPPQSTNASTPVPADDVAMTGFSDDDDEEDAGSGLPDDDPTETKAPSGKSKQAREAELHAMMDQEDEEMEDAVSPAEANEMHDEGAIDTAQSQDQEEPKETVTVENGRRRGRRRVMKKKTAKDENGYLVTTEEPAWESFSEDEPALKKPKVEAQADGKATGKKIASRPGQGNIMSFFSKK